MDAVICTVRTRMRLDEPEHGIGRACSSPSVANRGLTTGGRPRQGASLLPAGSSTLSPPRYHLGPAPCDALVTNTSNPWQVCPLSVYSTQGMRLSLQIPSPEAPAGTFVMSHCSGCSCVRLHRKLPRLHRKLPRLHRKLPRLHQKLPCLHRKLHPQWQPPWPRRVLPLMGRPGWQESRSQGLGWSSVYYWVMVTVTVQVQSGCSSRSKSWIDLTQWN